MGSELFQIKGCSEKTAAKNIKTYQFWYSATNLTDIAFNSLYSAQFHKSSFVLTSSRVERVFSVILTRPFKNNQCAGTSVL